MCYLEAEKLYLKLTTDKVTNTMSVCRSVPLGLENIKSIGLQTFSSRGSIASIVERPRYKLLDKQVSINILNFITIILTIFIPIIIIHFSVIIMIFITIISIIITNIITSVIITIILIISSLTLSTSSSSSSRTRPSKPSCRIVQESNSVVEGPRKITVIWGALWGPLMFWGFKRTTVVFGASRGPLLFGGFERTSVVLVKRWPVFFVGIWENQWCFKEFNCTFFVLEALRGQVLCLGLCEDHCCSFWA